MYINIIGAWFTLSMIWWFTFGLIGLSDLEDDLEDFINKKKRYPEFISIWRCLTIGYYESKDDYNINILGKVCITILVAILYLPVLPLYSLISFIGFVLYKLFTWKPRFK